MCREIREAIEQELINWPQVSAQFGMGGKHPFVQIIYDGKKRRITYAGSPSENQRSARNVVKCVRHACRDLMVGAKLRRMPGDQRPHAGR